MARQLLVVDDDDVHRSIICRIGEKAGFRSIGVDSFNAAAELLRGTQVDCVTLDISLGGRSGGEVLGLLSMFKCKFPIIVISGSEPSVFDETINLGKTLELDLRAAMVKPIDLRALRLTLSDLHKEIDLRQSAIEA
jgi:DNA-binding response OmpR family regulator